MKSTVPFLSFAVAVLLLGSSCGKVQTAPPADASPADDPESPKPAESATAESACLATNDVVWTPFAIEPDIEPGSALDFSAFAAKNAPCGVHGRVVARGDHFEFEDKPGEPVRFWGVNICQTANFPDPEKADIIARHLVRMGFNTVRLHHHDGGLVENSPDITTPRPEPLRRMDALIDACSRHGLYIITDVYVSRPVSWRAVGIDRDGTMTKGQFKHLVPIHDGAFSNWCAFASAWLGHTNAFTGRRLIDEPALMALAFINEGNLDNGASPEPFVSLPNWTERWQAWLAGKKAAAPETWGDIPDTIPPGNHWGRSRHVAAFSRFLVDVELDFDQRARRFLREELGVRAPLSNMSAWMNPSEYQIPMASPAFDYVEMHTYMHHPTWIGGAWSLPLRVNKTNPVRFRNHGAGAGAMGTMFKRVFGKPFAITEFNFCGPNAYRGAGGILFGAQAAAQDWSGAWHFDWATTKWGVENPGAGYAGLFSMSGDPLRQAAERAALCLFLRGDLAPCQDAYAALLPPSRLVDTFDGRSPILNTRWHEFAWRARLGCIVAEEAPPGFRWVDPYPDLFLREGRQPVAHVPPRDDISSDPETGVFRVATPRTCGIVAESGEHEAGALRVALEECHAAVWASVIDDAASLGDSSRILLGNVTDLRNTGMVVEEDSDNLVVRAWGKPPHLVRRGVAHVTLRVAPGEWTVWALSQGGRRRFAIPCATTADGRLAFTLDTAAGPDSATLLWEMARVE
ncbi:MAG: cellulase family glycosylhydrolase [Kiritimatiellia bacterium]|jgi:hypothetical protein